MSRILNVGANLYLDLYGSQTAPGTRIIVWSLNDPKTPNQEWYLKNSGSSDQVKLYCIVSGRNIFLRIDGVNAVATTDEDLATKFTRVVEGRNVRFDINDNSLASPRNPERGSQVIIDTKSDSDYQRWYIQTPRAEE